jgi:hypothetical protein
LIGRAAQDRILNETVLFLSIELRMGPPVPIIL